MPSASNGHLEAVMERTIGTKLDDFPFIQKICVLDLFKCLLELQTIISIISTGGIVCSVFMQTEVLGKMDLVIEENCINVFSVVPVFWHSS